MSKKTLIIMIVAGLLLVAAAVGATLFFTGAFSGHAAPEAAKPAEAHAAAAHAPAAPAAAPIYKPIEPAFVVNIEDGALVRFLQIQVALMSHEQAAIDSVDKFLPRISNDLILLFSAVSMDSIRTVEGRAKLQQDALDAVNKVLTAETGHGGIEAVYFTKLVVQ